VNAARALARAGLDTDDVRLALHPIRPESVNLYPASPLFRRLWGEGVSAMTLWRWVFVEPEGLSGDPGQLGRLAIHELLHLRQISELGLGRFLWKYSLDYLRGRLRRLGHHAAYEEIGLEREVRETTARLGGMGRPI
jgi:hypothetical protein